MDRSFDILAGRAGLHVLGDDDVVVITASTDGRTIMSKDQATVMAQYILDNSVVTDVLKERERQNKKWDEQNHPDGTAPNAKPLDIILAGFEVEDMSAAELASHAKDATDICADLGSVTWADILLEEVFEALAEEDLEKLRTELVQVAAVAVQWVEAIDRREELK